LAHDGAQARRVDHGEVETARAHESHAVRRIGGRLDKTAFGLD